MAPAFDFDQQNKQGTATAQFVIDRYAGLGMYPTDGRKSDAWASLLHVPVEIKCDTKTTGNFFLEEYSDANLQTTGGAARSVKHNIPLYCYYLTGYGICYWFEAFALVDMLNSYKKLFPNTPPKLVPNKGWQTSGYPISIGVVGAIAIAWHDLRQPVSPQMLTPLFKWAVNRSYLYKQPIHAHKVEI